MTRVAIIGAGPSGLSALRAFQSAKSNGEDIPEVVCFERQDDWGGLWKYTWRTGLDANGEPVHCSMYRYLWSNGPKECLEFADYTFDEHFGKEIASYPPRAVLFDYIEGRLKKSVARDWIRFNTPVRSVVYNEGSDNFTVTVHDHSKSHTYSEDFDYVINASGHFSTPNVPYFEGIDWFKGRVLHAHDFRDALEFKGKDILIVGASYSAEDIGSQCWKYGAKSITLAYRTAPPGYTWPDNWDERTNLVKVDGNTCHFEDGSSKDFDAIILCTGYLHHYPWLGDDLRLQDINRCWLIDLYQSVVWIKNPKLMYIGAQDQWFTFNMFDAQAWWARDVIMGKISLPSREEMEADSKVWLDKEDACETPEDAWRHQGAYTQRLIDATDYPSFDMEAVYAEFYNWKKNKKAGIMTFRDKPHKSAMTGKTSPPHHTPWVDALDDSLEAYLSDTPEAAE